MPKVEVIVANQPYRGYPVGSKIMVSERKARVLTAFKRVGGAPVGDSYQTRVMTAQPPAAPAGPTYLYKGIALDDMPIEALRSMAETLGVEFHHNAGPAKIRQAIVDSAK